MKTMKKLLLLLTVACSLPLQLFAQDDLYFTPKKDTKKAVKSEVTEIAAADDDTPAYYVGSTRSVDEYNRRGHFRSYYEKVGTDSLGNDIFEFHPGDGVYPDSVYEGYDIYPDSLYNYEDDFGCTRYMEAYDGYYGPWGYYGRGPWWWGYYGSWYDPWYYGYYGWYSPWYYYGYYSPWYWWGGYPYYHGGYAHHHGGNPRGFTGGRTWSYRGGRSASQGTGRIGTSTGRSVRNRSFGGRTTSSAASSTRSSGSYGTTRSTSSFSSSSSRGGSFGGGFGGGRSGGGGSRGGGSFGGGRR